MKLAYLQEFLAGSSPSPRAYDGLFRYFLEGFCRYRSSSGALASYPGLPSFNGSLCDRLEGFARFVPLVAGWLHGGRERHLEMKGGGSLDLVDLLVTGLEAGTNPDSPDYWGSIGHGDQRIVEAADVALALWLARDSAWAELPDASRRRVVQWLLGVNGKRTADNNWHLFIVVVNVALRALGEQADPVELTVRYQRFKSFYCGDGWYSDGPGRKFDYYNAWGIHYPLNWVRTIDPEWDSDFLATASESFLSNYRYFFGPCGFPIMGRSVCYRMAAPAPLVQAAGLSDGGITVGEARRALDLTWRSFIAHGAVARGTCTQGYGKADPRVLDNYSGPASPLWSLRSLAAALAQPDQSPFWQSTGAALPVELGDFEVRIPATGWMLRGHMSTGDVELYPPHSLPDSETVLQSYAWHRRIRDFVRRGPGRPDNERAKYRRASYGSCNPYCGFG